MARPTKTGVHLEAYAIKKPAFRFGIPDLAWVKDSDEWRLTATPFVPNYEEKVYLGHAVPWKGVKAKYPDLSPIATVNKGVAEGLKKAIEISKECAGVEGVTRVGTYFLPKKVICQMEKAGKKATPA